MIATSQRVGQLLCESLGLDAALVRELHLHVRAGHAPILNVRMYVDEPGATGLAMVTRRFELCEKADST